jgi:hypothetical protein
LLTFGKRFSGGDHDRRPGRSPYLQSTGEFLTEINHYFWRYIFAVGRFNRNLRGLPAG